MTPSQPPKQPTGNVQTIYMSRLKELKKDYDNLERTEEKLLEMLETVRREEGYLVKALNDEVFTGQVATTKAPSTTTSLRAKEFSSHSEEQQTKKPPPPVPGRSQIETEATAPAKDTTTATAIDNTTADTRMSTRRKRRLARPMAQSSNTDTVRHLEVNRRAQRREERVLARQRLENALFAEDDDDSTSSSSS